ncbi:ABC transporter substrate-binding protein [Streptomyces phaeochromogenes]|uniref:ABC transporter substrate-binding protein n=1 Tax=Streptomyces phaeochromogenes TaxID=1923 RepID=A0ABZ1HB13_STRPH|nr:ABC transporter substrate-binding protein [Streptomyces phaeochromogenes]WSD14374.1 ABC transporter substrate-binding protein [Streptomyces phaeochromogenes]
MAQEETRSLVELYDDARAEGGTLTVYAGGDTADQQDMTVAAFNAEFPDIELNMIVDYSKYHNVRIDRQLATGTLVPDVTHLQTTFDFPRWKGLGVLLQYRPAGWDSIHDLFKDADGFWVAGNVFAFSYMFGPGGGPVTPQDLVDPRWKGHIASSHPGDDDATLFLFKSYVEAYGWEWLQAFADQQVHFHRGTNTPGEAVDEGRKQVGVGGAATGGPGTTWAVPGDDHPFLAWGQRAAILRAAPHPAAAKFYLNWLVSPQWQAAGFHGWGVRTDTLPEDGRPIWEYPNAGLTEFPAFMEDRAEVERWRQTMNLYLGEVTGEPTPGRLGLRPTRHA